MSLCHPDDVSDFLQRLLALVLVLLLSPLILAIALAVRLRLGGPVLFSQRPGLHGRPFQLVKFRTMTQCRDGDGSLLPDGVALHHLVNGCVAAPWMSCGTI